MPQKGEMKKTTTNSRLRHFAAVWGNEGERKTGSWKSPAQDTKTSVAVDLAGAEGDGLLDGRIALILNLAGPHGLRPE